MSGLSNIFGKMQKVEGINNIHPIRLNQYEEFMECAQLLSLTEKHFEESAVEKHTLFELVVGQGIKADVIHRFIHMLYLVTGELFELKIADMEFTFIGGFDMYLDKTNFESFREVTMKQNLLYEDKVFKNPMVKQWADKVLEARSRNSVDMSLEDIVSVVHVFTGISYDDISAYTIYQLKHTFQRILKVEDYNRDIQFMCAGDDKTKPKPFMEKIELYQNPYDDVFVDKNKLNNLNKAIGNK
ncbi:hypothetical protein [Aquibacillus saliphilus]|uniref:hypothetical protein n=1 Tax=Aquibacillus saliphilus TaxID=1909422 RepID=UPI001CF0B3BF|nr:hypothetical protein [Aquibacillus saliphilus]